MTVIIVLEYNSSNSITVVIVVEYYSSNSTTVVIVFSKSITVVIVFICLQHVT